MSDNKKPRKTDANKSNPPNAKQHPAVNAVNNEPKPIDGQKNTSAIQNTSSNNQKHDRPVSPRVSRIAQKQDEKISKIKTKTENKIQVENKKLSDLETKLDEMKRNYGEAPSKNERFEMKKIEKEIQVVRK